MATTSPPARQAEPKGGTHLKRDKAPSTDGAWFDYHITVQGKRHSKLWSAIAYASSVLIRESGF